MDLPGHNVEPIELENKKALVFASGRNMNGRWREQGSKPIYKRIIISLENFVFCFYTFSFYVAFVSGIVYNSYLITARLGIRSYYDARQYI